jgi:hypothetical protein
VCGEKSCGKLQARCGGIVAIAAVCRLATRWTTRKAVTLEALNAHEPGRALVGRKIGRQFKCLSALASVVAAPVPAKFPAG